MMGEQVGDEIVITPEMITAGVRKFQDFDSDDFLYTDPALMVQWVFEAMWSARAQVHSQKMREN